MPEAAVAPDGMLMAFDFGERRIGVAVGETLLGVARPLVTIDAEASERRFDAIRRLLEEWKPGRLIVGRPTHADREAPHALAARCERFGRQLSGRFGLPVDFIDERYTSCVAASRLGDQGFDGRKHKGRLDAEAAAVILQAWFDQQHALATARH